MNKKLIALFVLSSALLVPKLAYCLAPFSGLLKLDVIEESNSFTGVLEKQLSLLQDDKAKLEEVVSIAKKKLEALSKEIAPLKEKLEHAVDGDQEFLSQKLLILNQDYQTLLDIEQLANQLIGSIENHSKHLQEYKQDPEFKSKNLKFPAKSLYTLPDMLKIYDLLLHYQADLKDLEERSKKVAIDLVSRQKSQTLARQEYNEKKKHQEEFSSKSTLFPPSDTLFDSKLSLQQQGELLDEEEQLYKYKKELADIRVKEIEQKRNFLVDYQIRTTKIQLNILKDEYERIKSLFQVDEKLKRQTEIDLERERQESALKQKKYKETIDGIDIAKDSLEQELNAFKQQYDLSVADLRAMGDWSFQPNSLTSWSTLIAVHRIMHKIVLAQINKEQLLAQIEQEKTKVRQQEVLALIVNSWYKLTRGELDTQEEITKEIKLYETLKADIQAMQTSMSDKRALAGVNLNANAKLLDNIKLSMKELKEQKDTIFKGHETEYTHYFSRLKDAEDDLRARSEPLARIVELYAQIQDMRGKIIQKIDGTLAELQGRASAKSAPGALLKGLQNFVPDVQRFFKDTRAAWSTYYANMKLPTIHDMVNYYSNNIYQLLSLILQLLSIFLVYILIRFSLPDFISFIGSFRPNYGIGHTLGNFVITTLRFIYNHLRGLFICLLLFLAAHFYVFKDPAVRIAVYLALIPCLLYYVYKFISYIAYVNEYTSDAFLSKPYQKRFLVVFSFLLYSTVITLLFRSAFLVGNYHKSTVSVVLLAFNFIVLQISLICLIGREQVLSIIPRSSALWQLVYDYINKYYVLFLMMAIFIIFMSNPYVGYGPHFFNIVSRIILILLLIPVFSALHNKIKRVSAYFFFKTDGDEAIKERFYYGKTSYGIFVIGSFLFFAALGFIIAANIWGYPIGLQAVSDWFYKELYRAGLDDTGHPIMITPLAIIKVFLYVVAGALAAFAINKFVLRRMFDLLLVNVGVQNALLSLTRYFVILASLVIGLQSVGIQYSLLYIFAVVGALGVAGKELVTDVIAYFIILVQRPIKIGDLVMLDEETKGIVRHITLRSVFLRRKNSVTVIIPNSFVMNRAVVNWSYSRSFFAFDDIIITVPYTVDPIRVKELLLKVLDSNINILKNPAPIVQLQNFAEHGFQFMVRAFLSPDKVLDQFDIASDIRIEIVRILRAHDIEIAWPTRVVKIVTKQPIES